MAKKPGKGNTGIKETLSAATVVQGSNPGPVLRVSKGHLGVELLLFRAGLGVSPLAVYTDHMPGQSSQLPIVAVKAAITAKAALIKRLQECQAQ